VKITNSSVFQKPLLHLSKDGYLRLNEKMLRSFDYNHFSSGLYEEPLNRACKNDTESELSGYMEWVSRTVPKISIGWDWMFVYKKHPTSYVMVGLPYSNIMLHDVNGMDLDPDNSQKNIAKFINSWNWGIYLNSYITQKYS
jgi:hypothetical protein